MDVLYIGLLLAFLASIIGFAGACARLEGKQ